MTDRRFGVLLLLPAAGLIALLFAYPIFYTLNTSVWGDELFSPSAPFVGLANYRSLVHSDDFWRALRNALVYASVTVTLQVVGGTALALLLSFNFRGRFIARGLMLLPYMLPSVASALIWKWMYNDLFGILNDVLLRLHVLKEPLAWLAQPKVAMGAVIAVAVWRHTPFVVLVVLARLLTIPSEYYESAAVDGANACQRFWNITLPQLGHVLMLVVLLRFLWVFNEFDTIWLLTQGGPLNATLTLSIMAYMKAFVEFKMGQAAAITVVMLLLLAAVSIVYLRLYRVEQEVG